MTGFNTVQEIIVTGPLSFNSFGSMYLEGVQNSGDIQQLEDTLEKLSRITPDDTVGADDGKRRLIGVIPADGADYIIPDKSPWTGKTIDAKYFNDAAKHLAGFPPGLKEAEFKKMYEDRNHPFFLDLKEFPGVAVTYYSTAKGAFVTTSPYEAAGNYVYGLVGTVGGISESTLRTGANILQEGDKSFFLLRVDAAEDRPHVNAGIIRGNHHAFTGGQPDRIFEVGPDIVTVTDSNSNSVMGSIGGDVLYGQAGDDRVAGGGGADRIYGDDGADIILGQSGFDDIAGGDGGDMLSGGDGSDYLFGMSGSDVLFGDADDDNIYGDEGDDVISGGTGNDIQLVGDVGNDVIDGGDGYDHLYGGFGNDVLVGGTGPDLLIGDIVRNGSLHFEGNGYYRLRGGYHEGIGADTLIGGEGNDQLIGGFGNDYLVGGTGNDLIDGAEGNDTVDFSGSTSGVIVFLGLEVAQDTSSSGIDTLKGVELLIGSIHSDNLSVHSGVGLMRGGAGLDFIRGGVLGDDLHGGADSDTLYGGAGADHLSGDSGDDQLSAESGTDVMGGGHGRDTLYGGSEGDVLFGDDGEDHLFGGRDNDQVLGGAGDDVVRGEIGDDILTGGHGNDRLNGGQGRDTIIVGSIFSKESRPSVTAGWTRTWVDHHTHYRDGLIEQPLPGPTV